MRLTELVDALDGVEAVGDVDPGVDVTSIVYDSRRVAPGSLFCALPGIRSDGRRFVAEAIAAGAVALLAEERLDEDVPQLVVPDGRHAMGLVASAFEGHPSRDLRVVGVTGTNGKTTTVHLVAHLLDHLGVPCGTIGTLTGARTTPESPDLQARLREFADQRFAAVAMEVSSHALTQRRVDGTHFEMAVFTNLSRDHLDYHDSMEEYFRAKARLFTDAFTDEAVVGVDDPYGRVLVEAATVPTRGYGLADAHDLSLGLHGTTFVWRGRAVRLPMGGAFNVRNALAALEVGIGLGLDADGLAEGLATTPPVPGRFELIDRGQGFAVVVDYAHTPDGLEQVLTSARELADDGRVAVVFGCGGDRDVTKRPAMGEVASRLADRVYLTSDNPRGEDPQEIIDDVNAGITSTGASVAIDLDRRAAIAAAIASANEGDLIVIAGKGHETTQTTGDHVVPFDDRVVAAELLDLRQGAGS
jgi:UDP-N-acetylmuramoyl-L-alanyl-D-glutamate--2,6-diaminopimelate ligase